MAAPFPCGSLEQFLDQAVKGYILNYGLNAMFSVRGSVCSSPEMLFCPQSPCLLSGITFGVHHQSSIHYYLFLGSSGMMLVAFAGCSLAGKSPVVWI